MHLWRMIERHEARRAALLLALLIAIAGLINVPWAVTMIPTYSDLLWIRSTRLSGAQVPPHWPSAPPHPKPPWPPPDYWREQRVFGCRYIDVRNKAGKQEFLMILRWVGWPMPVIEIKQTSEPSNWYPGGAPESRRPSLMLGGLLLNPLILGGSAWLALVMPWLIFTMIRRVSRWRNSRCLACGYPIGVSEVCSECGAAIRLRVPSSEAHTQNAEL